MKDLTLIELRDKARKDFEGKELDGKVIFQIFIDDWSNYNSLYLKAENNFIIKEIPFSHKFEMMDLFQEEYNNILKQCRKPFPKHGFCINLSKDKETFINLCGYIAKTHRCNWIDLSFSPEEKRFPEVTTQELKDEAVRILTEKN